MTTLGPRVVLDTNILVSGDAHLLSLGEFRGVKILTPRAFLDRLRQR